MRPIERSFSEVLQDIAGNLQTIVRSEFRLAKTELKEEIRSAFPAMALLAGAGLGGIFAVLFALVAAVNALSTVVPDWAAALIIAALLALAAGAALATGIKRLQLMTPGLPKTMNNLKENIEWTKQQIK
jgi:uncharacterized membrane protein YqjE